MKDKRKATVKDIAEKMNVSLSTVNKALTGVRGVSEKRRAEIVAVAKEMGYEVNHIAQSLSRRMIKIGIVIPSLWREYHGLIEEGMKNELAGLAQYKVEGIFKHVSDAGRIEDSFSELYDEGADIIVYCPSLFEISGSVRDLVRKKGVPIFISGDSTNELPAVCQVLLNSGLSAYMAADMLALSSPEKSAAAVFIGSMKLNSHRKKAEAFRERATKLGFSDVLVYETFDDESVVGRSIRDLTDGRPEVKAIYAATATIGPIADHLEKLEKNKRPSVVATDVSDRVREAVKNGCVCAAVFQNQRLIGRLTIRKAYEYITQKKSYGGSDAVCAGDVLVNPQLFLPSRIEEFGSDSGIEYMLDLN